MCRRRELSFAKHLFGCLERKSLQVCDYSKDEHQRQLHWRNTHIEDIYGRKEPLAAADAWVLGCLRESTSYSLQSLHSASARTFQGSCLLDLFWFSHACNSQNQPVSRFSLMMWDYKNDMFGCQWYGGTLSRTLSEASRAGPDTARDKSRAEPFSTRPQWPYRSGLGSEDGIQGWASIMTTLTTAIT